MAAERGVPDAPLVFVDDPGAPRLSEEDLHHLGRVLRLRPGSDLTVSDGRGRWRPAVFTGTAEPEPTGDAVEAPAPPPELAVGFALVKGDRPELIVQKLTELGIDRILPFLAARSVVRWDERRAARQMVRLRRVAREACMQCRRVRLPDVVEVQPFDRIASPSCASVALAQRGGDAPSLRWRTVLIGPEGGWSPAELKSCPATVSLGHLVLRAETAAITAGGVLAALRSGLVRPATESASEIT